MTTNFRARTFAHRHLPIIFLAANIYRIYNLQTNLPKIIRILDCLANGTSQRTAASTDHGSLLTISLTMAPFMWAKKSCTANKCFSCWAKKRKIFNISKRKLKQRKAECIAISITLSNPSTTLYRIWGYPSSHNWMSFTNNSSTNTEHSNNTWSASKKLEGRWRVKCRWRMRWVRHRELISFLIGISSIKLRKTHSCSAHKNFTRKLLTCKNQK